MNATSHRILGAVAIMGAALAFVVLTFDWREPSHRPAGKTEGPRTDPPPSARNAETSRQSADRRFVAESVETPAERAVTCFYEKTDYWAQERSVSIYDIQEFLQLFNSIPQTHKRECLHRALNLIPDENIVLLAGILLDKSQPNEIARVVFNDILNRPEEVKKPILDEIYNDETHSCHADAEWVYKVTGEKPNEANAK